MSRTTERRKTLSLMLTDKPQRYFILLEFVLFTLTLIYLLYLVFRTVNEGVSGLTEVEQSVLSPIFDEINFLLLVRISELFLVVFLVNALLGLFYLHRLTGPLVRMRVVLSQIAEGKVPDSSASFRKGDFPSELAEDLKRALEKIRELKHR